jgi:hypothetical protein
MKTACLILAYIATISANICFVWAGVEFILYLVKDHVFNWWSIWGFLLSIVVTLICVALVTLIHD